MLSGTGDLVTRVKEKAKVLSTVFPQFSLIMLVLWPLGFLSLQAGSVGVKQYPQYGKKELRII